MIFVHGARFVPVVAGAALAWLLLAGPRQDTEPFVPSSAAKAPRTEKSVMVFAHRGDSCCAPENTVVAIEQAFQKRADHVEIDVRLAKDGTAVLMHDETVDRTTNGTGSVSSFTVQELRSLDAGAWFDAKFAGTRIPTLKEALETLQGRGRAYLDIKTQGAAPAIRTAIEDSGVPPSSVWCWAHNFEEVRAYRQAIPGVPLLYGSVENWRRENFFKELRAQGVEGFSVAFDDFATDFSVAARRAGLFVDVFTVQTPGQMRAMIAAGVDGIVTDYPERLRELLP